ncbi:MAG: ABC transporter ATP-binding protein [Leptonema sp. (in: bacteria)]
MIQIKNLNKSFRKQKVLRNINIEIPKNQLICLLGPNGSGKTTFIKSLLGLVIPDQEAKIYLDDKEVNYDLPKFLNIGYVPQMPLFPQNLLVKDLIEYLSTFENHYSIEQDSIIELFGIKEFYKKKISELSGGMKQKINILQCFMRKRDMYVLDEPTASLDPYHSFILKNLIKEKKHDAYLLFITHNLSEVEELADQMIVLIDGELKLNENPVEFIKKNNASNLEEALSKVREYIKI